uniref:Uncharacterized protein n=1 Tax=Molossus molossus TaxID=27622 RepID=A0A7J8C957_MOLMO|nr:hypothetical protein HJG59_009973 [Molossus molossus]
MSHFLGSLQGNRRLCSGPERQAGSAHLLRTAPSRTTVEVSLGVGLLSLCLDDRSTVQGRRWLQPLQAAQGTGQDPRWTGRPSVPGPLTHTLRPGQRRHNNSPLIRVSGMWEDTRVPGESPET